MKIGRRGERRREERRAMDILTLGEQGVWNPMGGERASRKGNHFAIDSM